MIFYYIRHGDPIYNPDSLTELGQKQAEALAKRLAVYGLDKIYASTPNRAVMTAQPTCALLNKETELVDFANEHYAWRDFCIDRGRWVFQDKMCMDLFVSDKDIRLDNEWYNHPKIKQYNFGKGVKRVDDDCDAFFKSLGYEHIRGTGGYKVIKPNNQRVALFAHQGFGMAFLSSMLDIPYPMFVSHFDICHSSMTVINFEEVDGFTHPHVLMTSNDSHIYKENVGSIYNNQIEI